MPTPRPPGLILAGDSPHAAGARAMWARRREQYGPNGLTAEGAATLRKNGAWLPHDRATHCVRGHKYTVANTARAKDGKQRCRACQTLRRHRRRWAALQAGKLARLKAAMVRAHPDRGGTPFAFIHARRRYLAALQRVSA